MLYKSKLLTLTTIGHSWYVLQILLCVLFMGPSGRFTHVMIYWTVWDRFIQVLYLGRAPRTKETMPDFREKCLVTRHSRVFRGLTGSQRTPGFWGVTGATLGEQFFMLNLSKTLLM